MNVVIANIGMRSSVIPGVRSLIIVTMRLTAPASDEAPSTVMAIVQNVTPLVAANGFSVSGA